jgi:hypothetical protein
MMTSTFAPLQRPVVRSFGTAAEGVALPPTGPALQTGTGASPIADSSNVLDFVRVVILDTWGGQSTAGFVRWRWTSATRPSSDYLVQPDGCDEWAIALPISRPRQEAVGATPATRLIERVKHASTLTIEAIAALVGVSRRSIHTWQAGGVISQKNEERLRALAEAIEAIAAFEPTTVRERLMERVPGSIRIYDMLAEGHYKAAIARGTRAEARPQPLTYPAPLPLSTPLSAQVAALNDKSIPLTGRIDRRFTKRLKR